MNSLLYIVCIWMYQYELISVKWMTTKKTTLLITQCYVEYFFLLGTNLQYIHIHIDLVTTKRYKSKSLKSKLIVCFINVYVFAQNAFIFYDWNRNGTGFQIFVLKLNLIWIEWNQKLERNKIRTHFLPVEVNW